MPPPPHPAGADAGAQDMGKRKREGEDDMASLEAAVMGTRLQGFVSGGTVQPDQRTQDEGAVAAAGLCRLLQQSVLSPWTMVLKMI